MKEYRIMNKENILVHIESLQRRHDDLDKQITESFQNYGDSHLISEMKHKKLAIKDLIEREKLRYQML